jgi:HPt (histidine-containing phosphotransfer) domain-containing protein
MDAYVPKPIRMEELFSAIDAIVGGQVSAAPETPRRPSAGTGGESIDRVVLLANFGGRGDLVRKVIDVFLTDAPVMLARLGDATQTSNAADVAAAAHAIKGSAGLFSQGEAYADARALELRARGGDLAGATDAYQAVERSVSRLMQELESIRATL